MMALIATLRTTAVHFVKGSYSGFCTDPLYTGCLAGPDCRDDLTVEQRRGSRALYPLGLTIVFRGARATCISVGDLYQ